MKSVIKIGILLSILITGTIFAATYTFTPDSGNKTLSGTVTVTGSIAPSGAGTVTATSTSPSPVANPYGLWDSLSHTDLWLGTNESVTGIPLELRNNSSVGTGVIGAIYTTGGLDGAVGLKKVTGTAPTPATGYGVYYFNSSGQLVVKDTTGAETVLDGGGTTVSATAPLSPYNGQFWYQPRTNDSGGAILWRYSTALSAWVAEKSFGDITFYVDYTNGTDDANHGTGTTTSAFKTRTFCASSIPQLVGGNITINEIAETRSEGWIITNRVLVGPFGSKLVINGALTQLDTGTVDGTPGVQGSGATRGTVLSSNSFDGVSSGDLIYNQSVYRVAYTISANDGATIIGTWPGTPSGTVTSYTQGTVVDCSHAASSQAFYASGNTIPIEVYNIKFLDGLTNNATVQRNLSTVKFYRCRMETTASSFVYALLATESPQVYAYQCYINPVGNKRGACPQNQQIMGLSGCLIGDTSDASIFMYSRSSHAIIYGGTSIVHSGPQGYGVNGGVGGTVVFSGVSADGYEQFEYCTDAITAANGAGVTGTANNVYTGCTRSETATSASYGYID